MPRKPDLLSLIPSADVVRQSLRDARQRVAKLERLLVAAEAVESRPRDDTTIEAGSRREARHA